MYVKDYMSKQLVTIVPTTTVIEAIDLMKEHHIRRLPVVDPKTDKLLGLVTQAEIDRHSPSTATSLDYHELNYLLNKTTAQDVMIKKPSIIKPATLLEEAAVLMRNNKDGVLVIVDESGYLVGVITEKDIFDAFVDVLGYNTPGTRLAIEMPIEDEHSGVLDSILELMRKQDTAIDIKQIAVFRRTDRIELIFHIVSDKIPMIKETLEQFNYRVTSIIEKPN